jgi:hypothetical protein
MFGRDKRLSRTDCRTVLKVHFLANAESPSNAYHPRALQCMLTQYMSWYPYVYSTHEGPPKSRVEMRAARLRVPTTRNDFT